MHWAHSLIFLSAMKFPHSRKKVERAMKHISDLNQLLSEFSASDFYSVGVQKQKGGNAVTIAIFRHFPTTAAALIIGDALHNLRSALDLMYYRVFHDVTGKANKFTQFPIRRERERLISAINGGLKEKGLTNDWNACTLRDLVVDTVKPYEAGNWSLWALHDMSITDKHQLLIPVFKIMRFTDISLRDEEGNVFLAEGQPYFTDDSYWFRVREGKLTVHEKGRAATAIVFGVGVPLQDKPVVPALNALAGSVTSTIDTFEALDIRTLFE